ncbi:MAG: hypothetical protein ACXWNE_02890 [Candidatus Binataceae bacterium]
MQGKDDLEKWNAASGQLLAQRPAERSKMFEVAIEQGCRTAAKKRRHDAGEFFPREGSILTTSAGVEPIPLFHYLLRIVSEAFQQRM